MLILNEQNRPVDRITPFVWKRIDHDRMTNILRLFGKLIAYTPESQRAYYAWGITVAHRPAQFISIHQFSPAHLRVILFSHWEVGLVLGSWLLGMKLGQPLVWLKRLQAA